MAGTVPFDPGRGDVKNDHTKVPPVDPRAGKLCTSCTWWRCTRCGAVNDAQGRNDQVDLQNRPKSGPR